MTEVFYRCDICKKATGSSPAAIRHANVVLFDPYIPAKKVVYGNEYMTPLPTPDGTPSELHLDICKGCLRRLVETLNAKE